jgi:hypothetical protein
MSKILAKIQIKRGLKIDLPVLDNGEFGFCNDTKELFIGTTSGNLMIFPVNNSGGSITVVDSTINGNIVVNGVQIKVFDDSLIQESLSNKADINHSHQELHNHANSLVINELSNTDGRLTYNGQQIPFTDDIPDVQVIDDNSTTSTTKTWSAEKINTSMALKAPTIHYHSIDDIQGVDASAKVNGYVLQFDASVGKYLSKALPAGNGTGATSLSGLSDVDDSVTPQEGDRLAFEGGLWKPKKGSDLLQFNNTYQIELDRWHIKRDGTDSVATGKGINDAIQWAKTNGYNHAVLPNGYYRATLNIIKKNGVDYLNGYFHSLVRMPSDFHFELSREAIIEIESNSSGNHEVILFYRAINSKVSGGKIIGDRKRHISELGIKFVRGGVNPDGSLNNDINWIRSEVIDRYKDPILTKLFRIWSNTSLPNVTGYNFYQYKDTISALTLVGSRTDGLFAPTAPTGRGWFEGDRLDLNNKLIISMNISNNPLTDTQLSNLKVKLDNQYYTHESGHAIAIFGGYKVEVSNMELCNMIGDGVLTGTAYDYRADGVYDLVALKDQIGSFIYLHDLNIHRCRRQGISLCGQNDQFVYNNEIHHIGKDDDGVTSDFTAPAFGIDIESMAGESNIPYKHLYFGRDGLEVNYRIHIYNNYIHHNERGHLVNPDGTYVTVENNVFEGYNIGGVSSDRRFKHVKFLNNTLINCEQWVTGDNIVNGTKIEGGNMRLMDIEGAFIKDVKIKDGMFYGSAVYGHFGVPQVDVSTSTFTFTREHGMGNTAKVCFDSWEGKIPKGLKSDTIYYVINKTTYGFQVSETENGKAVVFYDSGENGFTVSRYNYGRVFIDGVTVERDFKTDSKVAFYPATSGGVIKNITVKNYDVTIDGGSKDYAGRPVSVDNLTVIEGKTTLSNCQVNGGRFISNTYNDVYLGTVTDYNKYQRAEITNSTFINQKIFMGESTISNSTIKKSVVHKENNRFKSIIINSYLQNTEANLRFVAADKSLMIAKSVLDNFTSVVTSSSASALTLLDNTNITGLTVDNAPQILNVSPQPAIFPSQQSVIITANQSIVIRYTIDGTDPTINSPQYLQPIVIASPIILRAIGLDGSNNIVARKSWFYDVDLIPANDVTNLTASEIRNSQVTLVWSASTSNDVVNYEIYNASNKIGVTTDTTYIATALLANTSYDLVVKVVDKAGHVSTGASINVTTSGDLIPPEDVTDIQASHLSDTVIGLTWIPSVANDVASYQVFNGESLLGESKSANFSISNLTPSTPYTFKVVAKDVNGNVAAGTTKQITTLAQSPLQSTGYVKNGLVMFNENVPNNSIVTHKDSYFVGESDFTFVALLKVPENTTGTIIDRRVLGSDPNTTISISSTVGSSGDYSYILVRWTTKSKVDGTYKTYVLSSDDTDLRSESPSGMLYQLAVRKDSGSFKLFLNGVDHIIKAPVVTTSIDPKYINGNAGSTTPLTIGKSGQSNVFKIIAYYNRALTAEEIMQNHTNLSDLNPPSDVTNLAATSTLAGEATLTWNDPAISDVHSKNVYYKLSNSSTWIKANTQKIVGQSYQLTGLASGQQYDLEVKVVDTSTNISAGARTNVTPL